MKIYIDPANGGIAYIDDTGADANQDVIILVNVDPKLGSISKGRRTRWKCVVNDKPVAQILAQANNSGVKEVQYENGGTIDPGDTDDIERRSSRKEK